MQEKLLIKAVIFTVLFFVCAMSSIIYVSATKTIVISDVAQDEVTGTGYRDTDNNDGTKLLFTEASADLQYLQIPLESGVKAESVTIENHYINRELWVVIDGEYQDFYKEQPITGNREKITDGYCNAEKKETHLKFTLTGVYEYRSVLENGTLYIEFISPREMYDKIIVIDPAGGGEVFGYTGKNLAEKNITLEVAKILKKKLDVTGIKVYYTRIDDNYKTEENRAAIANLTGADLLIRIETGGDKDKEIFGTKAVYNPAYFIPGFGNVELADLLEREVTTALEGKAAGLVQAGEADTVLLLAEVPAAAIKLGYVTNGEEAELLKRDDYLERAAEGIYQAVMKYYGG